MWLSARSPKLGQALARAKKDGLAHLILDGTLIAIDRLRADRPFYSGKHNSADPRPAGVPRPSARADRPTRLGNLFAASNARVEEVYDLGRTPRLQWP
jgi:hypothetical protein